MAGRIQQELEQMQGVANPGYAESVPQNQIEKLLADSLYGGRNFLNQKFGIPFVDTGLGLGDMLMGQAPEMFEDASWGAPYTLPTGHGRKLDPRVGDIAGLPLPYAGAGKLGQMGLRGLGKSLTKMNPTRQITDSVSDPSKRQAAKIGLAGLGLAATPKLATTLMDLAPSPAAITRVAAPAIARAAVTNPASLKMANLLLSLAPRTVTKSADDLAKIFKDEGAQGLEDAINKNGQKIQFQNIIDEDIDPSEVINLLERNADNPMMGIPRDFEPMTADLEKMFTPEIDDFVNKINHAARDPDVQFYELNSRIADLMDYGYDPKDIWTLIDNKIDVDSMPERIRNMVEIGKTGRSDYIGSLDQMNMGKSWEEAVDLTDPAGRKRLLGFRFNQSGGPQ